MEAGPLFWSCLLMLMSSSPVQGKKVELLQDPFLQATGVVAHQEGSARLLSALWTIVVVLETPVVPNVEPLLKQFYTAREAALQHLDMHDPALAVWDARFRTIVDKLALQPRTRDNRKKRSPVDFVGHIGRALFGIATMQDVERLAEVVNRMQFSVDRMHFNNDYMMTVLNATQDSLTALADNMDMLDHRTVQLFKVLKEMEIDLKKPYSCYPIDSGQKLC